MLAAVDWVAAAVKRAPVNVPVGIVKMSESVDSVMALKVNGDADATGLVVTKARVAEMIGEVLVNLTLQ